ncbi:MAG: hypothetical protein PUF12_11755 [Thermoflexaceae bacterium]|nr:hypothetical protein [Thermoflexaceae bacterium]
MNSWIEELQREWEEQQREWEREQERARIQKEISRHENARARALEQINETQKEKEIYERTAGEIRKRLESNIEIARGNVNEEYGRVMELFCRKCRCVSEHYDSVLGDAEGKIGVIEKIIADLYTELSQV